MCNFLVHAQSLTDEEKQDIDTDTASKILTCALARESITKAD